MRNRKGKRKADVADVNVFLPLFPLPLGRFHVGLEQMSDSEIVCQSDMPCEQHDSRAHKFYDYNLKPFSYRQVTMKQTPLSVADGWASATPIRMLISTLPYMAVALLLLLNSASLTRIIDLEQEMRGIKQIASGQPAVSGSFGGPSVRTEFVTITSTVCASATPSADKWWFGEPSTITRAFPAPGSSAAEPSVTDVVEDDIMEQSPAETPVATYTRPESSSLLPMLYVPLTWPLQYRIHFDDFKEHVITGWDKVWRFIEVVLHWPLVPER